MPNKKIFVVLIICLAIVASVYIFEKNTKNQIKTQDNGEVLSENTREEIDTGYDWKEVLTDTEKTTVFLNNTDKTEETTLTSDVAKNFFAQYLILKKDGVEITQEEALNIAKNTISSPEYAKMMGAQYNIKNIHPNVGVNKTIVQNYYNSLGQVNKIWLTHKIGEEFNITSNAITKKDEYLLERLDPIIADYKKIITMLLEMDVPSDATGIHLDLLNSTSNVLFSVESMRVSFSDPIKGIVGLDRYPMYMQNLAMSIKKIDIYFEMKGIK